MVAIVPWRRALAAPEAELVLVRIAGADPYQMVEAARYFRGSYFSDAVNRRRDDLLLQRRCSRSGGSSCSRNGPTSSRASRMNENWS